ncbi:hypothetical protein [Labedaea rhizosphaerae]|uniref:Uncharacterized protein n=1 Tax=Labedaea rhizosphaerae TaxID=598644 RepID=A0A4R6SLZ3_LABRH|nr:hypothetical protein [Labedaea rhizosphaerae]TDQ05516.1 hypothetical protein EV186_1011490 [Labedaea rhizosphaerae]
MDEAVYTWAITAVDHQGDRSKAEAWFTAIHAAYNEPEQVADYAEFTARLLERGAGGVDEAAVRLFAEDLERYESAPLDVVAALAEKYDTLADRYVELLAAAAAQPAAEEDAEQAAAAEEALWSWEDTTGEWSHYEDGNWVPQRSWDGTRWLVLNQEKTEWVVQRTWDGTRWWVMNEDRSEWVPEPGQEPVQLEPELQEPVELESELQQPVEPEPQEPVLQEPVLREPPEQEPPEQEPPKQDSVPPEPVPAAEAVVATAVMSTSLDEAMLEIPGLDGLTEDEIRKAMENALGSELKIS